MGFIGKQPAKAAITSSDITDGIVTADKLASDSVTTAKIADNGVTTAKINADAVTDAKIADDVVGSEHLTAGEVDTTALGADAVTAAKIADNAISEEHLDATVITGMTELAAEPADTDEFLISDAGTLKRIDYSHIKGGGAYTKLLETTINNNTELIYNNTYFTSTYRDFMFAFSDFDVGTDSTRLRLYISTDNGSSYISASEHRFSARTYKSDATLNSRAEQTNTYFEIFPDTLEYLARENANFFVHIFNPLSSSTDFSWYANGHFVSSGGLACPFYAGGFWTNSSATAVNTVKFTMDSGDMDQGKVTMYGRIS